MNGRQVSQSFKTLLFEAFAVFVELGERDFSFLADAADVVEFFDQFERLKALVHDFGFRFISFLLLFLYLFGGTRMQQIFF